MNNTYDEKTLDYLFDLQGYLCLDGALSADHVGRINQSLDQMRDQATPGGWIGRVHVQDHSAARGLNLQQIYEGGEPFEEIIDHPSWIGLIKKYVGGIDGLYIDENFANIRGPGQSINIHSGGADRKIRTQFRYHDGQFHCGQINVLIALTDIGPGDGATMVVPGSHKSNMVHPALDRDYQEVVGESADGTLGAIEVHMKAGDAILFVDSICHGSAARVNDGERRIMVYRYGPSWGNTRFGYIPSDELLDRLTDERKKIVQPIAPRVPS